jgi:hypothetical protein
VHALADARRAACFAERVCHALLYGDLVDDYLPIGDAIAEEVEMIEGSDAFNPETRRAALSALNSKRTNAVNATKRAVNIVQQIMAVNAMGCVKADFSERLENWHG